MQLRRSRRRCQQLSAETEFCKASNPLPTLECRPCFSHPKKGALQGRLGSTHNFLNPKAHTQQKAVEPRELSGETQAILKHGSTAFRV